MSQRWQRLWPTTLSLAPTPRTQSEPRDLSDVGTGPRGPQVKVLLIVERVEGFFLQRLTELGEHVGETQHDTLDDQADSRAKALP
jgi:hypothetical protein